MKLYDSFSQFYCHNIESLQEVKHKQEDFQIAERNILSQKRSYTF